MPKEGLQTRSPPWSNAMTSFVSRHQDQIQGTISGFDRLRFTGSLRMLSFARGLANVLSAAGVLPKDFGTFAEALTQKTRLPGKPLAQPPPAGRVLYLPSSSQSQEDYVR